MKNFLLGVLAGLIVPTVFVLMAAWSGRLPVFADAAPSHLETTLATLALEGAIKRAPTISNPTVITDQTLTDGLKLYRNNCAGCHGTPAAASDWGKNHFYPRAPQFAEHPPRLTEAQIFQIVNRGIRYSGMGGWSNLMKQENIWKVSGFLSRLDNLPSAIDAEWRKQQ